MATPLNQHTNNSDHPDKITYFAETDYRSKRIKFGIRDEDRARHMYVIGKTGMGKSTLLENLAIQDIQNGEGICFIDPHGGTAETLLSYVPEHRIKDVVYFAPFDQEFPVALNVMEDVGRDKRPLVASGLMGAFKKVWVDAWSARMEYILNNAMLALMETPGSTLLGVNRMFADKNYRNLIVSNVTDPSVKAFWVDEYAKYSDKFATEATAAIQNKVGQFAANPLIRNMVGQPQSTFDIRRVMDDRKILIVNLSKGRMGEGNANLVGSMLITKIYLAAMSRADVGADAVKDLPPFYLYVDEFQSFANESFADILSEARKYKLALTIAHQYIEQMSDEVRAAVFGNVGTMISFRVGSYDAEVLEKEFAPAFTAEDLVNLGFAQIYLKLMINGVGSPPFSATTLPRPKIPDRHFLSEVIAASREQFARPRAVIEEEIRAWHEPIPEPPRDPNAPFVPETRKYPAGARPFRPGASASYAPDGGSGHSGGGAGRRRSDQQYPGMPAGAIPPPTATPLPPYAPTVPIETYPGDENVRGGYSANVYAEAEPLPPHSSTEPLHRPFAEQFARYERGENTDFVHVGVPRRSSRPADSPPRIHAERVVLDSPYSGPERRHGEGRSRAEHKERPVQRGNDPRQKNTEMERNPREGGNTEKESPARLPEQESAPALPLSSLKSSQKRDKGPSQQNLSSLRDALRIATLSNEKKPEQKASPIPEVKAAPIPPSRPATAFFDHDPSPDARQKEIPEDVLRNVLSD